MYLGCMYSRCIYPGCMYPWCMYGVFMMNPWCMIHDACTYDVYIHDACMMYPGCMNTGCIYCKKFVLSYLIILAWRVGSKTSSLFGPMYPWTLFQKWKALKQQLLYREQLSCLSADTSSISFCIWPKTSKISSSAKSSLHPPLYARRLSQL